MRSETADFNLLIPLRALLEERSVSRAADRLGLSQPTTSGLLKKLRSQFGDRLLVRQGNSYALTPLAERLLDPSQLALSSMSRLFAAQSEFDPLTSDRTFTISASDFSVAVIGSVLSTLIRDSAPGVTLRFVSLSPQVNVDGSEALRSVDGAILPHGVLSGRSIELIRDDWVIVAWTGNKRIGQALTREDLSELPWVQSYGTGAYNPGLRQLSVLGITPRIEVEMPTFLALPSLIAGTPRIALLQASLARAFAEGFELRLLEVPVELNALTHGFWWHPSYQLEPDHQWLRTTLERTRLEIGKHGPGSNARAIALDPQA